MKLHEEDRRAVDLLLDQAQSSMLRQGGPGYAASGGPARIEKIEKLLGLLNAWQVEDPPRDLTDRTIRRLPPLPAAVLPDSHRPTVSDSHFGTLAER